ncbi:MAG: hypothetical protein FJ087_04895 [Deltaproteobacteria bacterium]|nr:hypothetical protein [Deltaproteobacteria bacterium]
MGRRTRIVCTLGPASSSDAVLAGLVGAGMAVPRLNFSHGTHESHGATLAAVRRVAAAAAREGRSVGVLQDLCGPKVRVGEMPGGGVEIADGEVLRFAFGVTTGALPVEYDRLAHDVRPGDRILFDDGALGARVESATGGVVEVRFASAGTRRGTWRRPGRGRR